MEDSRPGCPFFFCPSNPNGVQPNFYGNNEISHGAAKSRNSDGNEGLLTFIVAGTKWRFREKSSVLRGRLECLPSHFLSRGKNTR